MLRRLAVPALIVAVTAAGCSAGFSKPSAESLVERDNLVYAFVDPDPNQNTSDNVARLQVTADGRSWEPAQGDPTDLEGLGQQIGEDGVVEECHDLTVTCYRITAPDGGLRLERSATGGESWSEVWAVSAGRIEFQDRCCGSRLVAVRDLEFVPETGLVAVALGQYGLLTVGTDEEVRVAV